MPEPRGKAKAVTAGRARKAPPRPRPKARDTSNSWLSELTDRRTLTRKGTQIAQFLATNPRYASFASASDLAEKLDVNVATVVRFAQSLDFSGWPEFQLHFRHRYLGTLLPADLGSGSRRPSSPQSAVAASLERDVRNLTAALSSVDGRTVDEVAERIATAQQSLVISSGSYMHIGGILAHLATFMGYNVRLEAHGGPHLVADFASLRPGDCLIAISFWRLNKQVVLATQHARRRGIATVAITDSAFSPLAKSADIALIVPTESGSFFQSLTAPLSVVYGIVDRLRELGGARVEETIAETQKLYAELDVLYT
jgi:DNA-binding MurR/RpiR family transcriptional regulator